MRKLLVVMISVVMVLWLNPVVFAGWVTDDGVCTDGSPKDLEAARADLLLDAGNPVEEPWLLLGTKMCATSSVGGWVPGNPGLVVWEFDVDQDSNTGGLKSMLGIPIPPCRCKALKGFDIVIMQASRDQETGSAMAWCKGCQGTGGAVCATRTGSCEGSCYLIDDYCPVGGAGCYKLGNACEGTTDCYELTEPCPNVDCDLGRQHGEWYSSLMATGAGGTGYTWGRAIPLPPLPTNTTELTFLQKLPYRMLLERALAEGMPVGGKTLEQLLALTPRWQVSVYYDSAFTDGDDYITYEPLALNIADWLPHGNHLPSPYAASEIFNINYDECKAFTTQPTCAAANCYWKAVNSSCMSYSCMTDGSGDGQVKAGDLGILKKEFGRNDCLLCE